MQSIPLFLGNGKPLTSAVKSYRMPSAFLASTQETRNDMFARLAEMYLPDARLK